MTFPSASLDVVRFGLHIITSFFQKYFKDWDIRGYGLAKRHIFSFNYAKCKIKDKVYWGPHALLNPHTSIFFSVMIKR